MGHDASTKTRTAEGTLATATQLRGQREKDAGEIVDQLEAAHSELEALDGLDKLTADQALAEGNAKRRVRKLTAALEEARGSVEEAEKSVETAQHDLDVATLADLDAELKQRDAALIAEMAATAERWETERKAIFAALARAHTIDSSLRPYGGVAQYQAGSRGGRVALQPRHVPVLEAAAKILDGVKVMQHAALVEKQHAAARERGTEPYKPPAEPALPPMVLRPEPGRS